MVTGYICTNWLARIGRVFMVSRGLLIGHWRTQEANMFLYPRVYVQLGACSRIHTADVGCGITRLLPYYMFPGTSKYILLTEILVYCACLHILYIMRTLITSYTHPVLYLTCTRAGHHAHTQPKKQWRQGPLQSLSTTQTCRAGRWSRTCH